MQVNLNITDFGLDGMEFIFRKQPTIRATLEAE